MDSKAEVEIYMIRLLFIIAFTLLAALFFSNAASAQAVSNCPDGYVCITPAAARAALEAGDENIALKAELAAKNTAIDDLKKLLADSRIEFARCSGEATILKQRAVTDAAEKELLFKMIRPKSFIKIF
jgi:hypothetical protein